MKREKISTAVIRRMPRYYRHVNELIESGAERISSGALSKQLGLTASQIRQDFSCFGEFGLQGYGYNLKNLRNEIAEILGTTCNHKAILFGVGNLGRALIQNFNFDQCGFDVIAAFDVLPELVGTEINSVPILHADQSIQYIREHRPDVAVLCVQQEYAGDVAAKLAGAGISGIWNFTNLDLHLEGTGVAVENIHFADRLLTLSYMISSGREQ